MRKIIPFALALQLGLLIMIGISCVNHSESESTENPITTNNNIYCVIENKTTDKLILSVSGQLITLEPDDSFAIQMGTIFFIIDNKSYPYFLDTNLTVDNDFVSILIR